jgi:hypothetical protein
LREVKAATLLRQTANRWRQGCQPYAPAALYPHVSFFFFNLCSGTFGTAATTGLLYQTRMIGDGDCGEIGGMKIGTVNRSTRRKPAPAPLCPPQIPHDQTRV